MSIDAVITWVDASDPNYRQRINAYRKSVGLPELAATNRWQQSGEIEYCVQSIRLFAPWVRNIFIITDQQTPHFTNTHLNQSVRIIDHTEVFRDHPEHLPTFCQRSICSLLHTIPGLCKQFVYFNDDFMLTKSVMPEDFFRNDTIVIQGRWRRMLHPALSHTAKRPGNHFGQAAAARALGFSSRYFLSPHVPHAYDLSMLNSHFQDPVHSKALCHNIAYRTRSIEQYVPEAYMKHLALSLDRAVIDNTIKHARIRCGKHTPLSAHGVMLLHRVRRNAKFLCLQDLERSSEKTRQVFIRHIHAILSNHP